jgi:hypothetical protein
MIRMKQFIRRRKFAHTAIVEMAWNLHEMFNSSSALQKYPSLGVLKSQGKTTINAFRKELITKIRKVVHSDNPHVAMRKELMAALEHCILNAMIFDDEFKERRHDLYTMFNDGGATLSDQLVASSGVWCNAEVLFLTLLQATSFGDLSQEEWCQNYCAVYSEYVKNLYRSVLADIDGKERGDSALFTQIGHQLVEQFRGDVLVDRKT